MRAKFLRICLLPLLVDMPFLEGRPVVVVARENDLRIFRWENLVEGFFIFRTRGPIDADKKCLVAKRFDVVPVMVRYVGRYLFHSGVAFQEVLEVDCAIKNTVQLLDVGDAFRLCKREEFFLQAARAERASRWARGCSTAEASCRLGCSR